MTLSDIPMPLRDFFEQTPGVLGGKLRVRGSRVSVEQVFELLRAGVGLDEIVNSFPSLNIPSVKAVEQLAAHCGLVMLQP